MGPKNAQGTQAMQLGEGVQWFPRATGDSAKDPEGNVHWPRLAKGSMLGLGAPLVGWAEDGCRMGTITFGNTGPPFSWLTSSNWMS